MWYAGVGLLKGAAVTVNFGPMFVYSPRGFEGARVQATQLAHASAVETRNLRQVAPGRCRLLAG